MVAPGVAGDAACYRSRMPTWIAEPLEALGTRNALLLLAGANVACALFYGWDKLAAMRGRRRVPERTLLAASLPLTAPGAWAAVLWFRHKSSKRSYLTRLVGVTILQGIATGWAVFGA